MVLFAREEAKKLGMVEEGLPSEPGVPPKPNVRAVAPFSVLVNAEKSVELRL